MVAVKHRVTHVVASISEATAGLLGDQWERVADKPAPRRSKKAPERDDD